MIARCVAASRRPTRCAAHPPLGRQDIALPGYRNRWKWKARRCKRCNAFLGWTRSKKWLDVLARRAA